MGLFGKSKKEKFYDAQRNFDKVMQEKNMLPTLNQLGQIANQPAESLERAWEMQMEMIKDTQPDHLESYVLYWKDFAAEITNYHNEVKRIQGSAGPNLTTYYNAVNVIVRTIIANQYN